MSAIFFFTKKIWHVKQTFVKLQITPATRLFKMAHRHVLGRNSLSHSTIKTSSLRVAHTYINFVQSGPVVYHLSERNHFPFISMEFLLLSDTVTCLLFINPCKNSSSKLQQRCSLNVFTVNNMGFHRVNFYNNNNNNNNIYLTAIGLSPGGSGFEHIYKYSTLCY